MEFDEIKFLSRGSPLRAWCPADLLHDGAVRVWVSPTKPFVTTLVGGALPRENKN